ncbi:MAG: hydrogenase maturation nickel metallochaperone HypA, partial [Clostridiales bacterium]|nr:hydrogenase maturation nickel metallochaperone HypA [Clostridiales bacterium]
MHEYGLTKGIVRVALDVAARHGGRRVLSVRVVAGENVGLIPESVQMYFDQIAAGTLAEGAEVIVRTVKPKMRCTGCGALFERVPFSFDCPACGA